LSNRYHGHFYELVSEQTAPLTRFGLTMEAMYLAHACQTGDNALRTATSMITTAMQTYLHSGRR
jgi:hypothetical protein